MFSSQAAASLLSSSSQGDAKGRDSIETDPTSLGQASLIASAAVDEHADEGVLRFWECEGWVPRTNIGKQRTPNMIRNELQRAMDKEGTKGAPMERMLDVAPCVFYAFMDPAKFKKDPWRATNNATYWAAARFLEAVRNEPKKKPAAKKRSNGGVIKAEQKLEAITMMTTVDELPLEISEQIRAFLDHEGVTKTDFLRIALGGINSNSLGRCLAGKKQDQCANVTYKRAYVFFEKLRIYENKTKTKSRITNEASGGFSTVKERPCWVFTGLR